MSERERSQSLARRIGARRWRVVAMVAAVSCAPGIATLVLTAAPARQTSLQAAPPQAPTLDRGDVHVLPVRDKLYMIVGPASNALLQLGPDGVVVVDTLRTQDAENLRAIIGSLTTSPIRYIINTSAGDDYTGGNEIISKAGRYFSRERFALGFADPAAATIIAHEEALNWMSGNTRGAHAPAPKERWPTDTYFNERQEFFVNGEGVQVLHEPAAHSSGDSIVFFRRSDVLSTGDIFTPDRYPAFDPAQGGSINGVVNALNTIIDVTLPGPNEEGGTAVIPGRGRLCDESDVADYRDMVTIVRDRVQDMVKKRATLADVKAANLTQDYDGIYSSPSYTGALFVEAVYNSLTQSSSSK